MGGGGIFLYSEKKLILKEISWAEAEYMNTHTPITVLAPVLVSNAFNHARKVQRSFLVSHDVTAAIFLPLNKEMAAIIVSVTNPLGIEFCSDVSFVFCFD